MLVLVELVLVALLLALLVLGGWAAWRALQGGGAGTATRLPPTRRAELAAAIADARWAPGHDEAGGSTRILLRRTYTGLDGHPVLLEERVLESFEADDPAWEARFTEAMARARFRCSFLNAEDG